MRVATDAKGANTHEVQANVKGPIFLRLERRGKYARIAADLHDCLGQSLSAVKFGLETMSSALDADAVDDARVIMSSVMSTVKDALSDVRRLAMIAAAQPSNKLQ